MVYGLSIPLLITIKLQFAMINPIKSHVFIPLLITMINTIMAHHDLIPEVGPRPFSWRCRSVFDTKRWMTSRGPGCWRCNDCHGVTGTKKGGENSEKKQNDVDLVGFFGWVRIVVSDDFVDIFARLFCPFFWYYLVVKSPRMLTVLDDPARMDARWFIPLGGL